MTSPLPVPNPLIGAKLDRRHLHIFVAGPGLGEGIAVALPNSGWVIVDGCETGSTSQRESILLRLVSALKLDGGADPLELMVLTHPHQDHAQGFAKTIEALDPRRVMLTSKTPAGPHLLAMAKSLYEEQANAPVSKILRENAPVVSALRAVERWTRAGERTLTAGIDGVQLTLGPVQLTVRAPHACVHLDNLLNQLAKGDKRRANQASVVVQLEWKQTSVILGGDLPTTFNHAPVDTGWNGVMDRAPALARHRFLKIAHHGSREAHEARLMAARTPPSRIWALTPHTSGREPLPSVTHPDGLPRLLGWQSPIHMSHPLPSWNLTGATDFTVPLASLQQAAPAPTGDPFADNATDITPSRQDPLDPVWGFALDDSGGVVQRFRGKNAIAII